MNDEVIPDSEDEAENLPLLPTKTSPFEGISPPSDQAPLPPPAKSYVSTSISEFSNGSVEPRVPDSLNDISYFTTNTNPARPSSSSNDTSPLSAFTSNPGSDAPHTSGPLAPTAIKPRPRPKPRFSKPAVETLEASNPLDTSISSFTNTTVATDDATRLPHTASDSLSNDHLSSDRRDVSHLRENKASSRGRSSSSSAVINISSDSEDGSGKPRKTLQSIPLNNRKKPKKIVVSDDEGSEYNYDEDDTKPAKRKRKQPRRSTPITGHRASIPPNPSVEDGKENLDSIYTTLDDGGTHKEVAPKPKVKSRAKATSKKRALPPSEGEKDPLDMLVITPPPTKKRKTKRREDKSEVVIKSREFIDDEDDAIDQRTSGPPVPLLDPPVASSSIPKSPRQPSPSQPSSHRHPRSASPDPIPLTKRKRKAVRMSSEDEEDGNAGSARVRHRIIPIEGNLQDVGQLPVYTNSSTSNIESDKAGSEREQFKDGNLRNEEVKTKPKKKPKGKANGKNTRADQESTNASTPQDEGRKGEEEATGLQKPPAATETKNRKRTKGDDAFEHLTPHEGINPNSATHGENTGSEPSGEDAIAHLKPKSQTPVDKPKASPVPLPLKVGRPTPKVEPIVNKPKERLTVADILRLVPQTGGGLHRVGLSKRERLAPLHARLRTPPPPPPRLPKPPKKKGKDEDEEDSEEEYEGLSEAQIARKREEKRKAAWYSP